MGQFKNKCCNHQEGSTTNPPITNSNPQGQLQPGKDPGNITQSCFVLNKLPNIETVKELAFELCNIQQAFDKCPQYYTKSNFDALINTITKALFHLYVKSSEISGESVNLQQEITYSELVELINTNSLNPGQEYKITDYTFTTTQEFTASANHDFDIIVSALNTNTLNENAKAACKENDEYFKNSKLNLWELKYSIYNDTDKYNWADTENGKGVIYWLKDEFNNEAGYDFKSALFKKCVQRDIWDYKEPLYVEECSQYITFNRFGSEETDLSLVGDFTNCKIAFQKKLPFIKLTYKGSNINISGRSVYIYNGININLEGSVNYIETSQDLNLKTSDTTVLNSYDIITKGDNMNHYISQCRDIQLGFENSANYLVSCQYIITNSRISTLDIKNWNHCKIDTEVTNLISKDITLEYSTIGYNNQNVTFIGKGTFKNKTINPSTFTTSWQEPNYEFEFNSDIADEYETISKKQFVTYID